MSDDRVLGRTLRPSTVRLAQALVDDAEARNITPPGDIVEIASVGRSPGRRRRRGADRNARSAAAEQR